MPSRICTPQSVQVAACEAAEAGSAVRPVPSDPPNAEAALAGAKAALRARLAELQQVIARPDAHACTLPGYVVMKVAHCVRADTGSRSVGWLLCIELASRYL